MPTLNHIALIPDGNRRWAKKHGLPVLEGHRKGAEIAGKIFQAVRDLKIPYCTVWGCSVGNLTKRSKTEVRFLYRTFEEYFKKLIERKEVHEYQVRIRALGRWREFFPERTQAAVEKAVWKTAEYDAYHLTFLLAYSGLDEMIQAVKRLKGDEREVTAESLKDALWTRELPPVDLVVRTGGEPHWSQGFMMWDVAEAQLAFTETLWPAFSPKELQQIVERYRDTERRRGA